MNVTGNPGRNRDVGGRPRRAPLQRLTGPGERGDRLTAIAEVRGNRTAEVTRALASVATAVEEDPIVRAAAITALAVVGRTVSIEPRPPAAVRSAARKASAIAAARDVITAAEHGDPSVRLPGGRTLQVTDAGAAIERVALPAAEVRRVLAASSLAGTDANSVQGIRCMGNEFAIIGRPDHLDRSRLETAPAHPAPIAIHHTEEEDVWTAPYDVLTVPAAHQAVRVVVVDERGDPRFLGAARVRDHALAFEVHAVERPGASSVTVVGRVAGGGIVIDDARTGTRSVPPRRPSPGRGTRG